MRRATLGDVADRDRRISAPGLGRTAAAFGRAASTPLPQDAWPVDGSRTDLDGTAGGGSSPDPGAVRATAAEAALPGLGVSRRHLAVVAGAVIAVWILFVFARAVSDAASITSQEAHLRAQNAALQGQIAARQNELTTIQSPAFVALEGRAYGYGAADEQVFALRPGAPLPPHIAPLGTDATANARQTPFDAWLELLFGH